MGRSRGQGGWAVGGGSGGLAGAMYVYPIHMVYIWNEEHASTW